MSQVPAVPRPPACMHQHILLLTADVQQNYPGERGSQDERIAEAVTTLGALAPQGVRTIADRPWPAWAVTCPRIQRAAEQVPELNSIVASATVTQAISWLVAAPSPRLQATIMRPAATPFPPIRPRPCASRYVPVLAIGSEPGPGYL